MPKTFSHAYTYPFDLISHDEDGEDVTADMLRAAIMKKLDDEGDIEIVTACGAPFDTEEREENEPASIGHLVGNIIDNIGSGVIAAAERMNQAPKPTLTREQLLTLVHYADTHLEDWRTGIDDGTYDDREGLEELVEAISVGYAAAAE